MCSTFQAGIVAGMAMLVFVGCSRGGGAPAVPVAPPAGVTATPGDGHNIITWDTASDAVSYNLYWAMSPGVTKASGRKIADVVSPLVHTGLVNGRTYYYVVTTVNAVGESAESTEVSATPANGSGTTDPLFADQWHLQNTGQGGGTAGEDINVTLAWADGWRGEGIRVAVVDDGLEIAHEDLAVNVATGLSYDYVDNDTDPSCPGDDAFCRHGTAVAGIVAARDLNDLGVRGVSPRANLVGYNLLQLPTVSNQADAMMRGRMDVHVSNNSWGPPDNGNLHPAPLPWRDAITSGLNEGRDGRGTVYVWAAGNGAPIDYSNFDGYVNHIGVVPVCAVSNDGRRASYSESGANLWLCAPSQETLGGGHGISTTDASGIAGYNTTGEPADYSDLNYTRTFGGTSAATPQVAGVVALMLQANPDLGWRDVKLILAASARQNDPTDPDWTVNGAGYRINHKYGFGVVDTYAAVSVAKTWVNVGALRMYQSAEASPQLAIPDNDPDGVSDTLVVSGSGIGSIEYVEVTFSAADHPFFRDLEVVLTNETTGTVSRLAEPLNCGTCTTRYDNWVFGSARHLGEPADGTWTLRVADRVPRDTGTFQSWRLKFYGR